MKIKFENIPQKTFERICENSQCDTCVLGKQQKYLHFCKSFEKGSILDLPEKYFPTNREWMVELSNEDLAALLTTGLMIHGGKYDGLKATLSLITDKEAMLEWLSQPCVYLMEEE